MRKNRYYFVEQNEWKKMSSLLFDVHFHSFETEVNADWIIGTLGYEFGLFEWFVLILDGEVLLLERGQLILFLFAFANILFGRVVPDKLVAVILFGLELKVLITIINVLIIKLIILLLIFKAFILIVIILNFNLNLITKYNIIIQVVERIEVIVLDHLSLGLDDLLHVLNHALLDLQVYL